MSDGLITDPDLVTLLKRAAARKQTAAEIAAGHRAWVIAEMGMGSDADEAAYSEALRRGDYVLLGRLNAEADARMRQADQIMKDTGL